MEQEGTTVTLTTTDEEKDLGAIISSNLKPNAQCLKAANKSYFVIVQQVIVHISVLVMVKRNFPRFG